MPKITDPITIGTMHLKNRYVVAPTVNNLADERGYVTDRLIENYRSQAQGGSALVQVQATWIRPDGKGFRGQLGFPDDVCGLGLERLVYTIHRAGARASIQIFHAGAIAHPRVIGTSPVGPVVMPTFQDPKAMTRALPPEEVEEIIGLYGKAARLAMEVGFDAVAVHACHGSLIQQFLSATFNTRQDIWGQNRLLFPLRVIEAVKSAIGGKIPLIWRISAEEHAPPNGFTLDDTLNTFIPAYERAGVDLFDVSVGGIMSQKAMASTVMPLYFPRGPIVHLAEAIKKVTPVPVITVGKIMDPKHAEKIVERGQADLVALCRPIIADPEYPRKAMEGRSEDIRKCIGCNYCTRRTVMMHTVCRCAVNASYGREQEYALRRTERPRKVLVIGGGVAGMEAAIVAAQRGHEVTLYEKEPILGGLVNLASQIPHLYTRDLANILDYQTVQLKKLGINVVLGKEVTPLVVEEMGPEVIILATGSRPYIPEVPGIDKPHVFTYDEYLKDRSLKIGEKVVVIGGHEGAETAVSLARAKKQVTLIEESDALLNPPYLHDITRRMLLSEYLNEAEVKILPRTTLKEIIDHGLKVITKEGKEETLEADTVILALKRISNSQLARELSAKYREVYEIGDCVEPRSIAEAIDDAAYWARQI